MDTLFCLAEECLFSAVVEDKLSVTRLAVSLAKKHQLSLQSDAVVRPIGETAFPSRPKLLPPRGLPSRKLNKQEGQAAFFHALTHIEFVAISLAWDIIYRFRGLPAQFYWDWLRVADEEAAHFERLRQHLTAYGCDYGDLPAHTGLWEHAQETADNLLARLAIVHRCLEARGLDVTPAMIEKFESMNDSSSVALLSLILRDEIGHVSLGSYWFRFFCLIEGREPIETFKKLLVSYYKGVPKGPFNRDTRIVAGFKNQEIDWLEHCADEKL